MNYNCKHTTPKLKDTVFTEASTNTYFVKFDEANTGKCFGIIMQAGESWGNQPNTGGNYDCMGTCGVGCSYGDANWARNCLRHDVCSYYFGASGMFLDNNCGADWNDGVNDYTRVDSACKTNGDSRSNRTSSRDIPEYKSVTNSIFRTY